ncbi:phage holin family protein [Roseisolibacter sp. H3M3-2]|uniref:phage holin family protein n=1 Tax=Roseisolibacter sp. H3M3-2 TaxID=3031323 RepID=UPI0023DBC48D|nr:phage holin family protein [Roseisolibacter sp. H3M3-2]MDF1505431.1 phage holin family protein [Roseisolibacter sp. H3M3-2]
MASRPPAPLDPDAGIPDLIRRLADDSKRLALDEVRLAKLEMKDNVRDGAKGGVRLAIAFGAGVVALTALTIALAALLGRLLNGNYWAGTLIVGALELGAAFVLVTRGLKRMAEPEFGFPESREALKETAQWVKAVREPELTPRPARADLPRATQGNGRIPERAD